MASQKQRPLIRTGLIASLLSSVVFAFWWMNEATPYFADGPRDIPGLEGWWNITLGVGSYVFVLGLLHTLPPWALLFLAILIRRKTASKLWSDRIVDLGNVSGVAVAYAYFAGIIALAWCFLHPGGGSWIAIHFTVVFLPGVMLAVWSALIKTITQIARPTQQS